jgi:hypothetical protein
MTMVAIPIGFQIANQKARRRSNTVKGSQRTEDGRNFLRISAPLSLKVPKREILDRSDFPDFYTIKSLRVGDFGVKIKKFLKNI